MKTVYKKREKKVFRHNSKYLAALLQVVIIVIVIMV